MTDKKSNQRKQSRIDVKSVENVDGNVNIAGRDIVIHEAATEARTDKEYQTNELAQLDASILNKIEDLKKTIKIPLESNRVFLPKPLEMNEGEYLLAREDDVDNILKKFKSQKTLVMSGRGGVGKTSLIQAGLFTQLISKGHFPVLVSVNHERLDLEIKRSVMKGVETTKYLKQVSFDKFLEHVTDYMPADKWVIVILDGFEKVYFSPRDTELDQFEKYWESTRDNPKLRWLFSMDEGFVARSTFLEHYEVVQVQPLQLETARQMLLWLEEKGIKTEKEYVEEILNELGNHRMIVHGAAINPAELMIVLKVLSEKGSARSLSILYEEHRRVDGIFEEYLNKTLEIFKPEQRKVIWHMLTILKDQHGQLISETFLETAIQADGFDPSLVSESLHHLHSHYIIASTDQRYELANVNLVRAVRSRQDRLTNIENAREEFRKQLGQIRASAMRGLIAGGIGYFVFRWIVEGPVVNPTAFIFFSLLYGSIGGMIGLLLTLLIDVFIARNPDSHRRRRYLISTVSGLITFGVGFAVFVYLSEKADNKIIQMIESGAMGAVWGAVTGIGIAWALGSARIPRWKIPVVASISAIAFLMTNILLEVLNNRAWPYILLGGFWFPLVIVFAILFWKSADLE